MNFNRILIKSFLLLFITLFSFSTNSQETEIVTLITDPYPPYVYENPIKGEEPLGFGPAVIKEIFKRLNVKITIRLFPWSRVLDDAKKGKKDAIFMISKNSEREKFLLYTDFYARDKELIYYKKSKIKKFEWKTFSDLAPYTLGLRKGVNYGSELHKAIKRLGIKSTISAISETQGFKMLNGERFDLYICVDTVANELFKNEPSLNKDDFGTAKKPLIYIEWHIAFSKKSPKKKLIPEINNVIKEMKKDGTINKIRAAYGLN